MPEPPDAILPPVTYPLVYRWGKYLPKLKGQRCRLLARGAMNTALVEFVGGAKHIVSRNALAKHKGTP